VEMCCYVGVSVLGRSGRWIQLWNCINILSESGDKRLVTYGIHHLLLLLLHAVHPGYLGGGLPCLSSALWCPCPKL